MVVGCQDLPNGPAAEEACGALETIGLAGTAARASEQRDSMAVLNLLIYLLIKILVEACLLILNNF